MLEQVPRESLTSNLLADRAAKAWSELQPEADEPEKIELLKWRPAPRSKAVYLLSGAGPGGTAVIAKRCHLAEALLERTIYEEVLPRLPVPRLHCYGSSEEADGEHGWLFVEDAGERRFSALIEEHRRLAARWLAFLHTSMAGLAMADRLPERGPGYFLGSLRSARERILGNLANPALTTDGLDVLESILSRCATLEARWSRVADLYEGMPRVIVHGDFKNNNVRVRAGEAEVVLLPFDWACAGVGVPAIDLAQSPQSTPDFSCNPDLNVYWRGVREHWPNSDLPTIRRWANLGNMLRSIEAINWDAPSLAHEWVEKPLAAMRLYRATIDHAIGETGVA